MRDVPPSAGCCSTSSNSKFSLLNRGVLMSATKANTSKFTQPIKFSGTMEESCTKKLLPKIKISPMRKIQLHDSDTDAVDEQKQNKAKNQKEKSTFQENWKPQWSAAVQKSESVMNNNWATPAFDEFCSEYYCNSTKDAGSSQQKEGNTIREHFQCTSSGVLDDNLDGYPPAMHYFFHQDPRVRDLIRGRLEYFRPIGVGSNEENEQSGGKSLSYRRQFHSSVATNDEWVTPNRRIPVPTDVGKRRVHASGTQSGSGHWFTNDSGRRVYVSKSGQELSGQDAYRQYQKEIGRGFNRYKKKGSSGAKRGAAKVKVETGGKQSSSGTKRGAAKVKTETASKQSTSRAKRKQ